MDESLKDKIESAVVINKMIEPAIEENALFAALTKATKKAEKETQNS
ncbi:MAG: hypothetical protein P4L59_08080 [Desulfosporosinus sp.]|nr:hypothetical protein [Desulfosporosinus sp.]